VRTLNLATVTAGGEPRISAVDGHFLHARWVFSTSVTSAKARHILARPAVSAS
jgi:pyridoxine/pyridoxamine 5'-phosphate oxidase